MRFSTGLLRTFALLTFTSLLAHAQSCTNPSIRREWRQLSDDDKQAFHSATLCLRNRPSQRYEEDAVTTRADDLTWTHVVLSEQQMIHWVANFLPWHRMLLAEHERMLREECGYGGPYPYWDWTIDADANAVPTSPIWDSRTGFGGNGASTGRSEAGYQKCVTDGPYSNLTLTVGAPPFARDPNMPHCLLREWNNGQRDSNGEWVVGTMNPSGYSSQRVAQATGHSNYHDFSAALEGGPHSAVHNVVSGDMSNYFAPNDPIFFMHHANIDRIWAQWQGNDVARLSDYSGFNDARRTQPASIDDALPALDLIDGEPRVRDYMDTRAGNMCYVYQ